MIGRPASDDHTVAMGDSPFRPAPALAEHLLVGRYRVGRRLGAGGFGAVYEGYDERLRRPVAVKLIDGPAGSPQRARREATAGARLDHPAVVSVYDAGEVGNTRFLVSELVIGRTLAELEADDELSDRDVLRVGLALVVALLHAHARGVIHRDVKPQNVMVPDAALKDGDEWAPAAKLADFGVAWLAGDEGLTQTGDIVGTLAYMAPEQASGELIDERVDVYALALVLYEALAGCNPVRAGTPAATARRVGTVLPPLKESRPDLPEELLEAIDSCLAPDPDERGTLGDLQEAMASALNAVSDAGGRLLPLSSEVPRALLPAWVVRAAGALCSGALAAGATALGDSGFAGAGALLEPVPVGTAVAAMAVLYPRGGFLAASAVGLAALVISGQNGLAVLVVAAAVAPIVLLARDGRLWALLALAPMSAALSVALLFVSACGRSRRWQTRIAAGAAGAWWLLLTELILDAELLFEPVALTSAGPAIAPSAQTAQRAVGDLVTTGAFLLAVVWGVAALVLPWVLRGASGAAALLRAAAWSGALAVGTWLVATAASTPAGYPEWHELVIGGVVATIAAIWPRAQAG